MGLDFVFAFFPQMENDTGNAVTRHKMEEGPSTLFRLYANQVVSRLRVVPKTWLLGLPARRPPPELHPEGQLWCRGAPCPCKGKAGGPCLLHLGR